MIVGLLRRTGIVAEIIVVASRAELLPPRAAVAVGWHKGGGIAACAIAIIPSVIPTYILHVYAQGSVVRIQIAMA
jgi:cephalosporin-C deacetylase-like acetyl esterase